MNDVRIDTQHEFAYITDSKGGAVEENVETVGRTGAAEGEVETVIQDKAIVWPDSFSFGSDNKLYFATSRIHEGSAPKGQYGIYRIPLTN